MPSADMRLADPAAVGRQNGCATGSKVIPILHRDAGRGGALTTSRSLPLSALGGDFGPLLIQRCRPRLQLDGEFQHLRCGDDITGRRDAPELRCPLT